MMVDSVGVIGLLGDGRTLYKVGGLSPTGEHSALAIDDAGTVHDPVVAVAEVYRLLDERAQAADKFGEVVSGLIEQGVIWENDPAEAVVFTSRRTDAAAPEPVDQGAAASSDVVAWEVYLAAQEEARVVSESSLRNQLVNLAGVDVLPNSGRGVRVRGSVRSLIGLAEDPLVSHAILLHPAVPDEVPLGADANQSIDVDAFRYGNPIDYDGGTNGSQIRIGLYEGNAGNWPLVPLFSGGLSTMALQTSCTVHTDCGATCGASPGDGANGCRCYSGKCYGNHVTTVASLLNVWDTTVIPFLPVGMPGARIYFAAGGIGAAIGWFASNNVHLLNISLSGVAIMPRDEAVRLDRIAVVNSAGNGAPTATACASPNVLCVGAYNHATNVIAGFSSFVDFFPSRETPDLVAPGVSLNTYSMHTGTPAWVNASGTSVSSPIVASVIAGLHDISKTAGGGTAYYPSLEFYPELSKALVMAASTLNIDGGVTSNHSDALDSKDGAGALQANVLLSNWKAGRWSVRQWNTTDPNPLTWRTLSLVSGQRIRVYMVWSRCPSASVAGANPDFDLSLFRGSTWVAGSYSANATYEVVDYTVTTTGTYHIKLENFSYSACAAGGNEHVGLAWSYL